MERDVKHFFLNRDVLCVAVAAFITWPVCEVNSSNSSRTKRIGFVVDESPTFIESRKNLRVSAKDPETREKPRGFRKGGI